MDINADGAARTGFWAAIACFAFSVAYTLLQLLEWAGLLGSAGGPGSSSTPLGIALLLTPSLLLGPSFVVMLAALHQLAPDERKVFTLAGLCFAAIYATLTGLVYFVQLTFVGPRIASGDTGDIGLLLFVPYGSFLFAVDLLGYSFMSLAALFAAFGLLAVAGVRSTRLALMFTGLLLPFLALQMFFPWMIWLGALWGIAFPVAVLLLALLFRRARRQGGSAPLPKR